MDNRGYSDEREGTLESGKNNPAKEPSQDSNTTSYNLRSTLAQVYATSVDGTSLIGIGLLVAAPGIVIASVQNAESGLYMNNSQLSWYASLLPITQPLGCLLGASLQNYIGRKHGLLIMHISCAITWLVLYRATNVKMLYLSAMLAGASIGLTESPGVTYTCEITTPKLRGVLVMCNNYSIDVGVMAVFLLSTFVSWRTSCLVFTGWAISSMLLTMFIPDSPVWLLNKGRTEEAKKALRRLRGWVSESAIRAEFDDLYHFTRTSKSKNAEGQDGGRNSLRSQQIRLVKHLFKSGTLRPFILILCISFFGFHSSISPARSYFLVILDSLDLPLDSHWLSFLYSLSTFLGGVACILGVRMFGKRVLTLASVILTSLLLLAMSVYIIFRDEVNLPWIFVMLYTLHGFTHTCIGSIHWILMGEIYPLVTRSIAAGMTAAVLNLSLSVYIKIFYHLQRFMSTEAIFTLYSGFGILGFFYLWIFMPETEGKTMAEIEELFADDARRSCPHFKQNK